MPNAENTLLHSGRGLASILARLSNKQVEPAEMLVATADGVDRHVEPWLQRLLGEIRRELGMDVVFVSEFRNGRRVFRHVAPEDGSIICAGASDPLEASWCARVADGRIPQFIEDARPLVAAGLLPAPGMTIATHVSVPIVLPDGRVYGTICCFSSRVQSEARDSSIELLRQAANLLAAAFSHTVAAELSGSNPEVGAALREFRSTLDFGRLHSALGLLNRRVPFRFTGVYRLGDATLHNVSLFDRWDTQITAGVDAPLGQTFCNIAGVTGQPLEVHDGRSDARFPSMQSNPVQAYAGAPIKNAAGVVIGTLCHFDVQPCQAPASELEILVAAAQVLVPFVWQA